jgi:hypothetical protein
LKRQKEHAHKILRTQRLIDEWGKAERRLFWKEWVLNQTGYTIKWITRAENSGNLIPPTV